MKNASHPRRTAIVTGGSRGIGRAVTEQLARDGVAVAIVYSTRTEAALETVAAVESFGGTAIAIPADVADEAAMDQVFARVEETWGGVDVVVNSAGLLHLTPLAELDMQTFDSIHRANVRGSFVVAREAVRRVREGGSLIMLSSTAVATALPGYTAYAASKAAVDAMILILARELRGRDITVNAVAPGPTSTEMFHSEKTIETVERLRMLSPMERLGTADDIAGVISFLAGPGRWVNGQIIRVNGGVA